MAVEAPECALRSVLGPLLLPPPPPPPATAPGR